MNPIDPRQSHAVLLPCTPDQFSNFIGGLLGKPQTISQGMPGSFEVSSRDLVNIHHLLHQRISQQNGGELIQFTARIIFNDHSSVLINDLSDLINYNEVRPITSQQVHLSWIYLIRFNDRAYPEKQTVDLSFMSDGGSVYLDADMILPSWALKRADSVAFRIQHTARTWGADIQSLLDTHLRGLLTPESTLKTFSRRHTVRLQFGTFFGIIIAMMISIVISSRNLIEHRAMEVKSLINSTVGNEAKLNAVLSSIYNDPWKIFMMYSVGYFVIAFIVALVAALWMDSSLTRPKPSFIMLTPQSERYKRELLSRYRYQWVSFFGSMSSSIITGIISSILYAKFWGV